MKQVIFQGSYYLVPEWATHIAKDANGCVNAYDTKPWKVYGGGDGAKFLWWKSEGRKIPLGDYDCMGVV